MPASQTYRTIPDAEVNVNSANQQQTFRALRDNPLAWLGGLLLPSPPPSTIAAAAFRANSFDGVKIANNTIAVGNIGAGIPQTKIALLDVSRSEISLGSVINSTAIVYNPAFTYGQAWQMANGEFMTGWSSYSDLVTKYYYFSIGYYPFVANLGAGGGQSTGTIARTPSTWIWAATAPSLVGVVTLTTYYVTASPPYNLGHGDVPLFVFARVNSDGDVLSMSISTDPPWFLFRDFPGMHYGDDGKTYFRRPLLPCSIQEAKGDPELMGEYLRAIRQGDHVIEEITQERKNQRRHEIPHTFMGADDDLVVMIEPTGRMVDDLAILHDEGEPIQHLFHNGDIRIGNQPIQAGGPDRIKTVRATWR